MNTTTNAFLYLIDLSSGALSVIFLARIAFQFFGIPLQNPIALFVAKFTEPVVQKLQIILPNIARFNVAALFVVFVIDIVSLYLNILIQNIDINLMTILLSSVMSTLPMQILNFIFWSTIISAIFSWLPNVSFHPLIQIVHKITEPLLQPIRKLLPTVSGIDFSPIILLLIIGFLQKLLPHFF